MSSSEERENFRLVDDFINDLIADALRTKFSKLISPKELCAMMSVRKPHIQQLYKSLRPEQRELINNATGTDYYNGFLIALFHIYS